MWWKRNFSLLARELYISRCDCFNLNFLGSLKSSLSFLFIPPYLHWPLEPLPLPTDMAFVVQSVFCSETSPLPTFLNGHWCDMQSWAVRARACFFLHPVMSCDTPASQLHRPLLYAFVNVSLWMQQACESKMQRLEVCPVQGAFLKYTVFQFCLKNP